MPTTKPTRRNFLKATAGLAATAPYFWTSRQAVADSANDKFNLAAIGVGSQGAGIARLAAELGNIVACADVQLSYAERFAARMEGRCDAVGDYRKLLDRKDIDAITCGTPDHWHTKIAIDAMKAGKDVYCEKPLTLTMEESEQIRKVTEETGRVLQVGTQQRSEYGLAFVKAVAIAHSGRLGDKLHALASVSDVRAAQEYIGGGFGPFAPEDPPADLDWDFWLGQAPKVPYTPSRCRRAFRWWLEYSGGQVTDWGVHHADIALWALGADQTGVVEAVPVEGECEFPLGRELTRDVLLGRKPFGELPVVYNVATKFRVEMKVPGGNELTLQSGRNELIISGENGRIRVNRGGLTGLPVEEIAKDPKQVEWLDEQVRVLYPNMPLSGERGGHMANFFHCMKTREKPISNVSTGCTSANVAHMTNIAMLVGRPIRFDPEQYRFVDDAEANGLMSREQRAPYGISLS